MAHPFKVSPGVETLAGTRTLTLSEVSNYTMFSLDPGGAGRNVVMPTESSCEGMVVFLHNAADAAEILTVKASNGSTTICTPTQNETAIVWCNGTTWIGLQGANS